MGAPDGAVGIGRGDARSAARINCHMKAYSGQRKLAECWNSQGRMPLPGVLTDFVNDLQGRPLLVTEEANVTLAKAMPRVVKEIRKVPGDRFFTVIFDRGGYEGELFTWLCQEKLDFITYVCHEHKGG